MSKQDWDQIETCLEKKGFQRGDMILQQGRVCKHLYFIEKGLLRFFITKDDGVEITKFFTLAPYCFTSQRSFTSQEVAKENIQALESSTLWLIKQEDAFRLLKLDSWSTFVRKLIQEVQYYTEQILEESLTSTAENRYAKMLAMHDPLLQRVPLKFLASYLGIAPQSLSRIRKNLQTKSRS